MIDSADNKSMTLLALEEAVELAGGQTALARTIGKEQGHVSTWLRRDKVAAECVLAIEAATGVSRHRLRPDVFGAAPGDLAVPLAAGAAP
jgi:DNA-binding transcriptional regulator YdaS (Cro superfamily)